jgi:hypothetical protein
LPRDLDQKIERLEQEYKKVRRTLVSIMPEIMEKIDEKDFKNRLFEKRKE